ncbi:TPA: AraC family transcriptional regulator [Bacillus cereus]|uniref:hypothetical protein n=1 Tax=Bacillus TaxID=1386 RepID=UPI0002411BB4|nr:MULTISPECIES: hypothetical protein [Bacillus cereus group]ANE89320.1 AraC family transcriptional regulator [Bacillus cereus]EHL67753.1 hypothetical protein HMPREF1014_04860 [Bacillus sp. 7_6_55CFAA_CT2]MBY0020078.1 AraC family transcriptional regulator [Bacillus cereus]MCU4734121.1 AraC family transcriptional regulator [Bacillus cereus]MDA2062902.1 AraC family transcriptional regulator [Bacillus cereus]
MHSGYLTEWMLGGKTPSNYFFYNIPSSEEGNPIIHYLHSIQSIEGYGVVFCFLNRTLYSGKKIKLSGLIMTKSIRKSADLWIRGKSSNDLWEIKSLDCNPVNEIECWKEYAIILDIPNDIKNLSVGLTLKGEGYIWFHSMKVEIVMEK